MRKFLLFVLAVAGMIYWTVESFRSGKIDDYLKKQKEKSWAKDSVYGLAEVFYIIQKPWHARRYFEWILQDYPQHEKIDKVRWELAQCYENMGQKKEALEQYEILMSSYSATNYGKMAFARYGKIKY